MTTNPSDLLDPIAESACEAFAVRVEDLRYSLKKTRQLVRARERFVLMALSTLVYQGQDVAKRRFALRAEQPTWATISTPDLGRYLRCHHTSVVHTMEKLGLTKPKGSPCPT